MKKIVELFVDDILNEDLGVDIMSLVDDPAIGIGWVAMSDVDIEETILEMASKEDMGEIYDPEKIIYIDITKEKFSGITDYLKGVLALDILGRKVNKKDGVERKYKYSGPPAERNFCKAMMNLNKLYKKEEIDKMSKVINTGFRHNNQPYSLFDFKGGVNCRHFWEEIDVFRNDDGTLVMVSHGRVSGRPGEIASAGNNFWRFKNLDVNLESISDYPEGIKETAKKVIKWTEENGWGNCGTPVGKTRANQLANGEPISLETIKRMFSYLSRHKVDLESSTSYEDGCGKLMYDSWGGEMALSWSERILNKLEEEKMSFSTIDEEKRIVVGPFMIPNLMIKRKDPVTNEIFYIYYTEETIRNIAEKFLSNNKHNNTDINHSDSVTTKNTLLESWFVEDPNLDKAKLYGFENLPVGTWIGSYKINDDETWNMIKERKLNGFSITGNFKLK